MDQFQKVWAPIATIFGAVLLASQVNQAFGGNRTLVTGLVTLFSLLAISAGLWNYAFTPSVIPPFPKYKFHWVAKILFGFDVIAIMIVGFFNLAMFNIIPDCCGFLPEDTPYPTVLAQTAEFSYEIQLTTTPHVLLPQCARGFIESQTPLPQADSSLTLNSTMTPTSFQAARITIPTIGVDAPIVEGDGWEQLKKGIGHHIASADPGASGNVVLVGHNDSWGELLRYLYTLNVDDQIIIADRAERKYIYLITKIETIDETMVNVLDNVPSPILTLITCHPYIDDTKRLIITAKLSK